MYDSIYDENFQDSQEFSTIKHLKGREQNKRKAMSAVMFYTHTINMKSAGNWTLFSVNIILLLILAILSAVFCHIIVIPEYASTYSGIFALTWIVMNSFFTTVVALKHTIMYFIKSRSDGTELLIISKPVSRKILYWTRVLYLTIYLAIYSLVILGFTLLFCLMTGIHNFKFSIAKLIFLLPISCFFLGIIVMSITLFFGMLLGNKNTTTLMSLITFSALAVTPTIGIMGSMFTHKRIDDYWYRDFVEEEIQKNWSAAQKQEWNENSGALNSYVEDNILNQLRQEFSPSALSFTYIDSYNNIERKKEITINQINEISWSIERNYSYGYNEYLKIKKIQFQTTTNEKITFWINEKITSFTLNDEFYKEYTIKNWENGSSEVYNLVNSWQDKFSSVLKTWISGDSIGVIKEFVPSNEQNKYLNFIKINDKFFSTKNLNPNSGLSIFYYLNFMQLPLTFLDINDDVGLGSAQYLSKITLEPFYVKNETATSKKEYMFKIERGGSWAPNWAIIAFWSATIISSLFVSYILFRKKDFK